MPDLASGWESDGQELSRRVQRSRAQRLSDPLAQYAFRPTHQRTGRNGTTVPLGIPKNVPRARRLGVGSLAELLAQESKRLATINRP